MVSTEDDEIADVASLWGAEIIWRPNDLAGDTVPLDPVIYHAVKFLESHNEYYDLVITLQPTLPLISSKSIDQGIKTLIDGNCDSLIGVTNATHLYWIKKGPSLTPLFEERKNRQLLDPIYRECGFFISRRDIITATSRIGGKLATFILPNYESIDIDTYEDLWTVEGILKRIKIAIRVDGDYNIGLGHVYRMLSLANKIIHHNIRFYMTETKTLGVEKVKENNFPISLIRNNSEFIVELQKFKPELIINDILDTNKSYILKLKKKGFFVVNFEDLGEGSDYADLIFNALYENSNPPKHHYYGYQYTILRQDFYYYPFKKLSQKVNNILLTFGGVDQNDLTLKTLMALEKINYDKNITVILGLGYKYHNILNKLIKKSNLNIKIYKNIRSMAKFVYNSDVVATSKGRTVYEIASLAVPCVAIAQNEREMRHLFADLTRGVKSLGLASNVSVNDIADVLQMMIEDYELRKKLHQNLIKYNLKLGINNVINLIFNNYEKVKK